MLPTWIALGTAVVSLLLSATAVFQARSSAWRKAFRKLTEGIEDELSAQNRTIAKARDEFAELAEKATKRYRNAARAAAELARRDEGHTPEPEPESVPDDDASEGYGPRLHTVPAHVVADGRFGLGRSG